MEFGQRLADARKTKNISQEALADALGVSRQAVSKWETGESRPDVGNLIALCNALDLNIEYLCFGEVSAPEQLPVRKFVPLWAKILLYSATIVLSIAIGTCISIFLDSTYTSTEINTAQQVQEPEEVLTQRVDIVDLTVVSARAAYNQDEQQYEVFITPNVANKDLQLMLRIENIEDQTAIPVTAQCTRDGSDYKWVFENPSPNVNYRILAMFKLGETWKHVPVMNVHLWDGNCEYWPLWDSAGDILN